MKIIGHHTCSSTGEIHKIEAQGPFFSIHDENEPGKHKFLGSGYYFWDNNIGMAHSHGQKSYKRKYYIYKAILNLPDDDFLDLAGNRIDMMNFIEIINKMLENCSLVEGWTIGHFIEFLKVKGLFNYKAIRAVDAGAHLLNRYKFVPNRDNYTNLNPVFIVCLVDEHKSSDLIESFTHFKTYP